MELSAALNRWNPFRLSGTTMAPGLLLMCKLLAVAFLATRHYQVLPRPFLPFVPALDLIDGETFQRSLQGVALLAAIFLLFNRGVRLCAFALGCTLLLAVVSSKAYYGNNKTLVGLMLVLASLCDAKTPPYFVRWQFALVYLGAALNKLLDPDWQSGLFFDHWGGERVRNPVFLSARDALPPLVAGQVMSWLTIAAEFFVAVGVLVPRLVPSALAANALFQVGLLLFTGGTFTLFFYAMQAAALAFVAWPERIDVLTGSPTTLRSLRWLDADGRQVWTLAEAGLEVRDGWGAFRGVAAVARLLLFSPVFWMTACAALALAPDGAWRRAAGVLPFLLVLPAFWRAK